MPKKSLSLGIDVGGTKIRAGAVSPQGKVSMTVEIPTETAKGGETVQKNILLAAELVRRNVKTPISSIGIGMAGIVDFRKGIYVSGPNFPKDFVNVPVAAIVRKYSKVPTKVDNDVHCFTLAEQKFGAAKRFSTVVGLTLGTGIGGGIVLNGTLHRGRNNAAGEFGHMMLQSGGSAECSCGQTGHFEAFASGTAMRRLYHAKTGTTMLPSEIEKLAASGDAAAKEVVAMVANGLAEGIANVIHALNPDAIVIGGGAAKSDAVWKPMRSLLNDKLVFAALRDTPVLRAGLGSDAAMIGAALLTA